MAESSNVAAESSGNRIQYPAMELHLGGQLDFPPENNPEEAQPIMPQPNLQTAKQNPREIMQYSVEPRSYNLGEQLDFVRK